MFIADDKRLNQIFNMSLAETQPYVKYITLLPMYDVHVASYTRFSMKRSFFHQYTKTVTVSQSFMTRINLSVF